MNKLISPENDRKLALLQQRLNADGGIVIPCSKNIGFASTSLQSGTIESNGNKLTLPNGSTNTSETESLSTDISPSDSKNSSNSLKENSRPDENVSLLENQGESSKMNSLISTKADTESNKVVDNDKFLNTMNPSNSHFNMNETSNVTASASLISQGIFDNNNSKSQMTMKRKSEGTLTDIQPPIQKQVTFQRSSSSSSMAITSSVPNGVRESQQSREKHVINLMEDSNPG